MLFESWSNLARILIVGTLAYIGLVIMLRISGKRTLSSMNVFDFVVTVAFGSTLSAILLDKNIPLAEGLTAIALLVLLQLIVSYLSVHSTAVQHLVKAEPSLLFHEGRYLRTAMRKERITREDLLQAARQHGARSMDEVDAIVLETRGTISVLKKVRDGASSPIENVKIPDQ